MYCTSNSNYLSYKIGFKIKGFLVYQEVQGPTFFSLGWIEADVYCLKVIVIVCFRPAMIFMHGDLGWDQLQIMISKSTTVDLLKMYYKLDEFFSQQFKSSKRVFSALGTSRNKPSSTGSGSFRKRVNPRKRLLTDRNSGQHLFCPTC